MSGLNDPTIAYYERRAHEYDATSWDGVTTCEEIQGAAGVFQVLSTLSAVPTVDIGCGSGYVSQWLPGSLTLLDASPAMLALAGRRVPGARIVQAAVPPLPFADHSFGRAFTANFYGHLCRSGRSELIAELNRVAHELVVLDQLSPSGTFSEGPERRQLNDGSTYTIHKCYFTVDRLLEELGGGDVLMDGPVFGIVRRRGSER